MDDTRKKILGQGLLRAAIGLGIAGGVAVGATLIANAVTSSGSSPTGTNLTAGSSGSSSSTNQNSSGSSGSSGGSTTPATGPGRRAFLGGPGGLGGFGGLGGPVVHGQYTIKGPNGGYETIDERTGTVSKIVNTSGSNWSLTVDSADGTSAVFVVDSGTSVNGGENGISSVVQGNTVRVIAVDNNGTATAKEIIDTSILQSNGSSWLPTRPNPSSNSSGTSTSG